MLLAEARAQRALKQTMSGGRDVSVPICSTRDVCEHLLGCKMLLAGANGLRSASEQTMSGGRCSGSVSDRGVEEHRVIVRCVQRDW